ncbi:hypothetical protein J2X06_001267 [Lysobacter niastensis]|uniref:Apea-like HEPN domain-containing protein n=1 Tax=Lysobacter niastensis TaxID=380629 RepID=A0ABU1W908_9GAMM|nr:hypothetical protein [Lysobacter niastensis]MDR7134083.1 hypothetical protein [Lysobacter niastensis]
MDGSDKAHLESEAAAIVGHIVFALSRLEFDVGLYLRNAVGGSDVDAVNPLISRLSFKGKIDSLREVVEHKFAGHDACVLGFRQWYIAMDGYRSKRNSFVHGRWAFHGEHAINVAPGLPNSRPQKEMRYLISDLAIELSEVREIVASFGRWRHTWPL